MFKISQSQSVKNKTTFLDQDFMVQGGDPTGTGRGGTSIYGQKLCAP
jgi:cyclophilin family peptidyl-prolyl cis-trans isomerase